STGISMHKGYAFVQFTNPFDARSACMGEDGRSVFGQILDVNLVAEPKPHQIGRKRPNVAKTSADWEQFYDSYNTCAAALGAQAGARLTPPLKRPRLVVPSVRQQTRAPSPKKIVIPGIDDLKTYSSPDILICGNCRELFSSLADFIDHRRTYCKLRFTCKCSSPQVSGGATSREQESASLMCALCKEGFASAWDLMVHAQAAHMVNIYQLASKEQSQESAGCSTAGESTAGSTAGSDVASEMVADHDGDTSNADDATPDMPKENGLNGDDLDGSDMMNGASPNPTVMETSMGMVTQ
ncbi:unnamed protein product, partial [Meganyctiphanes norvegica]